MASPLTTKLQDIPSELIQQILYLLSPSDLISCQLTSKDLHAIIKESVVLQYHIALTLARATDNPCSVAPLSEKLEDLESSEAAWSVLEPKFCVATPVKNDPSGIYDLTGGTYLLGNLDRLKLHYIQLPTSPSDSLDWRDVGVDRKIIDMGLCVFEHDLIAIVTTNPSLGTNTYDIELTFLEYSTGKPHPRAKESRILVMSSQFEKPAIGIEIVGENLVLILTFLSATRPDDRVFIYDWRANALKTTFSAPYRTYSGLVFLTEHYVLFPNTQTNTFEIFLIPRLPVAEPLTPFLILSLPALADGRNLGHISCRAEPNPIGDASRLDKRQRAQDRANAGMDVTDPFAPKRGFLASAEDAICVFSMRVLGLPIVLLQGGLNMQFELGSSFTFIIHRRAFLDLVQIQSKSQLEVSSGDSTDVLKPIPWAEWGPSVSRWFKADALPTRWITTTAGQRCVVISEGARHHSSPYAVMDFNADNVRKTKLRLEKEAKEEEERIEEQQRNYEAAKEILINMRRGRLNTELGEAGGSGSAMDLTEDEVPDEDASEQDQRWIPFEDQIREFTEELHSEANLANSSEETFEVDDDSDWEDIDDEDDQTENMESEDNGPFSYPSSTRYRHARVRCVEKTDKLDAAQTFAEDVEGSLPYAVCVSERSYHFDGVLLDEERVIGITTDIMDRIRRVDIHYFG